MISDSRKDMLSQHAMSNPTGTHKIPTGDTLLYHERCPRFNTSRREDMSTHQVGIVKVNDAELVSFKDKQDGAIYVALKPIVERIGQRDIR